MQTAGFAAGIASILLFPIWPVAVLLATLTVVLGIILRSRNRGKYGLIILGVVAFALSFYSWANLQGGRTEMQSTVTQVDCTAVPSPCPPPPTQ